MKKDTTWIKLIIIMIIGLPLIYTAWIYPSLPQTVPLHFNSKGKADQYGSKQTIWTIHLILTALSIGVYLLIRFLPKIDPKKTAQLSVATYRKISFVIVCFLSCIQFVVVHSITEGQIQIQNFLFPLLGLFFSVMGYLMGDIKPNYFIGFRLPWTLENDDNWTATHQLVKKLWVPGGVLLAIITRLTPFATGFIIFLAGVLIITIIPIVFSYRLYRNWHK